MFGSSVSLFPNSGLTSSAGSLEDASGRECIKCLVRMWHSKLGLHELTDSAKGDRMGACLLVCLAYSVSITVDCPALSH